jgi:arginine/lysine/ornithine decarboxylase
LRAARIATEEISVSSAQLPVNDDKPIGTFTGEGVFADSAALAAKLFGADEALTLTYGSTFGNQLIARLLKRRGDYALIAASSHHSVINACVESGVEFCRVAFGYDAEFEAAKPPTPASLGEALRRHPTVTAVWLTSPTYEGATPREMKELGDIVHEAGAILIVDAAWGSHHAFHPDLPAFPTSLGADIAGTSLHKTGGAVQGAALLLINTKRIDDHDVLALRDDKVSSSPSVNILASIDQALREMARRGRALLEPTFNEIALLQRYAVERLPGLDVWKAPAGCHTDPGRVTFSVARYALSGFEVRDRLVKLGVAPEKAGLRSIVFLCPFQLRTGAAERTVEALATVLADRSVEEAVLPLGDPLAGTPERPLTDPGAVARLAADVGKRVPLAKAAGWIAAESAELYPPGVSLLIPGFPIDRDAVEHLVMAEARGGRIEVPGGFDGKVLVVDRRSIE